MDFLTPEITQLGGTVVVAIVALWLITQLVKEAIGLIKPRKNGNDFEQKILEALQRQNDNHLHTISGTMDKIGLDINAGNDRVVEAIKAMHIDLAGKLGEIKGSISRLK